MRGNGDTGRASERASYRSLTYPVQLVISFLLLVRARARGDSRSLARRSRRAIDESATGLTRFLSTRVEATRITREIVETRGVAISLCNEKTGLSSALTHWMCARARADSDANAIQNYTHVRPPRGVTRAETHARAACSKNLYNAFARQMYARYVIIFDARRRSEYYREIAVLRSGAHGRCVRSRAAFTLLCSLSELMRRS